jgi:hypothetical protein
MKNNKSLLINAVTKHPKCKGWYKNDWGMIDGPDFGCDYNTIIYCDECIYCNGDKDPENINSIDEFKDFINNYSNEILSNIYGESDGWNQKINIINKIINNNNIKISDNIWNDKEFETIINNI